jgi:serine/threonine protein kinase
MDIGYYSMVNQLKIRLENYTLENEISRDELAITYKGYNQTDQSTVAIKIVAPQFTLNQQFVEQFKKNVQQNKTLNHPNINRVYEVHQDEDMLYVVQELIEGNSLTELLKAEGAFAPKRMFKIARKISAAVDYAHQQGIIHGDLSGSCIYVGPNDNVIVSDFGQTQTLVDTSFAKYGYSIGTPEILAPELIHGQKPSRYTDLYAIGILCYQMLAMKPPFTGTLATILHGQAYDTPSPLHLLNPSISVNISRVIEQMLAKRLESRYNSGAEFTRALSNAIDSTVPNYSDPATQLPPTKIEYEQSFRKQVWFAAAVTTILLSLIFSSSLGAVSIWQISQTTTMLDTPTPTRQLSQEGIQAPTLEATITPTVVALMTPTLIPQSTDVRTIIEIPMPGNPTMVSDSPFTNLQLAQSITDDEEPENIGLAFTPGDQPIYLFFDYRDVTPGTTWSHRWTWGDTELATYQAVWSGNYGNDGTAWIFYHPAGGYKSGPYKVNLLVQGRIVSTATFVVLP